MIHLFVLPRNSFLGAPPGCGGGLLGGEGGLHGGGGVHGGGGAVLLHGASLGHGGVRAYLAIVVLGPVGEEEVVLEPPQVAAVRLLHLAEQAVVRGVAPPPHRLPHHRLGDYHEHRIVLHTC